MACEEVAADFEEGFANVGGREVVTAKGGGDNSLWVEFANALAEALEFIGGNEAAVADVAFVREVEIPIAMIFERRAERLDGAEVGIEMWELAGGGFGIRGVLAGESDVDDEAAAIAIGDEIFEASEVRFARFAAKAECGDGMIEGIPRRPNAEPIETEALKVIEILAEEFIGGAECAVVAEAEKECGFGIDGEMGGVDREGGGGVSRF